MESGKKKRHQVVLSFNISSLDVTIKMLQQQQNPALSLKPIKAGAP
jgi:hypothetical protein